MQQDLNPQQNQPHTSNTQDGQHLLNQIIIPARPAEWRNSDIASQYEDGAFTSRLDAEIADVLRGCQKAVEPGEAAPLTLSGEALAALKHLNCIALIQDGQVLPLLDIERAAAPMTSMQKAHLYHAAARTLLEAIAAIYEDRAQHAQSQERQDDDNEGECCHA